MNHFLWLLQLTHKTQKHSSIYQQQQHKQLVKKKKHKQKKAQTQIQIMANSKHVAILVLVMLTMIGLAFAADAPKPFDGDYEEHDLEFLAVGTRRANPPSAKSGIVTAPIGGPVPRNVFHTPTPPSAASTIHFSILVGTTATAAIAGFFYF